MSISKKIKMKLKYFVNRIKVDILNISELDLVIPGEISKDPFSDLIKSLSSLNSVKTIIEILKELIRTVSKIQTININSGIIKNILYTYKLETKIQHLMLRI